MYAYEITEVERGDVVTTIHAGLNFSIVLHSDGVVAVGQVALDGISRAYKTETGDVWAIHRTWNGRIVFACRELNAAAIFAVSDITGAENEQEIEIE